MVISVFSFGLINARVGTGKNSNLEMPTAADEVPRKFYLLQVVKGLGNEQPNKSFR